jgi:hypothetical protein
MTTQETRLLPLPLKGSNYAIVSMPATAWYWLDDLINRDYPGGYKALMREFSNVAPKGQTLDAQDLSEALRRKAHEECHRHLSDLYHLANDNPLPDIIKTSLPHTSHTSPIQRMPTVYRLFHFIAHATYMTTVWERRNYHKNPPLS